MVSAVGVSVMLDGEIRSLFGDVFGSFYLGGQIGSSAFVDDGYGGGSQTFTWRTCKLQVDACTERQKLENGYTARDVRVLILQASITARPDPGERVVAKGITYTVGPIVTEDPASSYWEIRGTPV